jgi:uncharacterized protein (DUF362 family)/Pyruvate/2-oxoacid:ferredoxin oxidoreductase delta subunit
MTQEFHPQVHFSSLNGRGEADLDRPVREVVASLGGLREIVRPGNRVLLKPDISNPACAVARTSPELVASVGRMVQECGGEVLIGDSPILPTVPVESLWRASGMWEVAEQYGFELVRLEQVGSEPVAVDTRVYYVSKTVVDADVIINLPRFRRDRWTGFAGAIGNMYGVVPGFQKGRLFAVDFSASEISRLLVDIYSLATPALSIVDGSYVDDPAGGGLSGFVGGAYDGVALDTVLASIMGFEPDNIATVMFASDAGLGIGRLEGIKVSGDSVRAEELTLTATGSRGLADYLPSFFLNIAAPFVSVTASVEGSNCDRCGLCAEVCPTNAVQLEEGKRLPNFRKPLCINCWCCHANCPSQAIRLTPSFLAGTFFQF